MADGAARQAESVGMNRWGGRGCQIVRRISGSLSRSDPLDCLQSLSLMRRLAARRGLDWGEGRRRQKERADWRMGFQDEDEKPPNLVSSRGRFVKKKKESN